MSDREALARAMSGDHCHGIVTRDGEQDACGKPAVAIIDGRGTEDETYWPACAYHAHRYGHGNCVPLGRLLVNVEAEAEARGRREVQEAVENLPELTEGPLRVGTALWPECDRDAYSLAIAEAQEALREALTTGDPA